MLPEPHPGPSPNLKKSIVPKRETPNTYPCQSRGPPGGGWAPAPAGGGPAGPAGPTPQAAGCPGPPGGGPERPLQRRRSPARAGGAASGPVPVGGAEECASRSPAGPGTWLPGRWRGRVGAAGHGPVETGWRAGPRPHRVQEHRGPARSCRVLGDSTHRCLQMPALWRDTVSRRPGNRA